MWSDDAERRAVSTLVAYHDTQAARRRTDIARPITASEGEGAGVMIACRVCCGEAGVLLRCAGTRTLTCGGRRSSR